jgi:hypothetical protein
MRKPINTLERLNHLLKVYICFDNEGNTLFGSVSVSQVKKYARANGLDPDQNTSSYPPGRYMHDKENRLHELIYKSN